MSIEIFRHDCTNGFCGWACDCGCESGQFECGLSGPGWYYVSTHLIGPFETKADALADAQETGALTGDQS